MAKSKQKAVKTVKKRSTKYSKLANQAAKDLAAKKAALVRAEKALSKAQKTHSELLSEVARLDMLDRSLKALINGTEPPQNVKYVYTYPQWVWAGYPYWNGSGYTLTVGQTQPSYTYATWQNPVSGNLQGGQQFSNIQSGQFNLNTTGSNCFNTVTTTPAVMSTTNSGTITCNASSLNGVSLTSGIPAGYSEPVSNFTLSNAPVQSFTTTTSPEPEFTVDLSTGATDPAVEEPKAEATEEVEPEVEKVGHGG
jgi:hypothetical protein